MDELDAVVLQTSGHPSVHCLNVRLCFGPKDRVAAADICHHRMLATLLVSHCNLMGFAGVAAVGIVRAFRQKPTEYAVLCVEHRQVRITNHFDFLGIDMLGQFNDLL